MAYNVALHNDTGNLLSQHWRADPGGFAQPGAAGISVQTRVARRTGKLAKATP